MSEDFQAFPKMARFSREVIITEKLDGTNAQIFIDEFGETMRVGSRNRWISPEADNYGFARWAYENREELMKLGPGRHFGEWWGRGIQRGYGLNERRFSLFNVSRWSDDAVRPACCHVVPVLYHGMLNDLVVHDALAHLEVGGSLAAPGFMNPEGVIIFHTAGNVGFKKTLKDDDMPKSVGANKRKVAA